MLAHLTGQIETITYTNPEDGFTIARVKVIGKHDLVTVVGKLMAPTPGEVLKMKGEWANHPRYGVQFKVVHCRSEIPASVHGIRKYLGSGLIKGLGPVMANRIVEKFGEDTLDIIENDLQRLSEVAGIGEKRIAMIKTAWQEQSEIRDVMIFLQTHGVSSGYAAKIFKRYGNRAIAVVKENPYRLASDIFGIGFIKADDIAERIGISKNSEIRVEAGILYVLQALSEDGHVYYPYEKLIEKSREILQVGRAPVVKAIGILGLNRQIVIEDLNQNFDAFKENHKAVYLAKFHTCETLVADRLKLLKTAPKAIREVKIDRAIEWVQQQLTITLAKNQILALKCALDKKLLVITGGPGTGKTTIINALLKILSRIGVKIMLAAPTGRAAKRLSETTGYEARTIHRLLEFSIAKGGFQKGTDNPLDCHLLVVDEASMIDTVLMYHLLKAVSIDATLVFVGDVNQLPSVGAGNVLKDMIESDTMPVVELTEIFRQAKKSQIVINAHKINSGVIPAFDNDTAETAMKTDFYFIEQEDPEKVLEIILELTTSRIPRRFGFDAVDDIQVLTPMHRGVVGAGNLNHRLQDAINPEGPGIERGERNFRLHDKVMQVRNNYDKEVFNGDIGRITRIYPDNQEMVVSFEEREVAYDFSDLDEIVLAYAISVHKSQGSEYSAVIMPILTQHYVLLQRNLIYTAVTRGRKLVVMVGTRKALAIGVHNNKTQKRYTHLQYRLG
ncbi:MAG: ATP-dependent RecD-like DNA helicase [Deltaproteobacteria bacterium]|nr:MAG: ATP-dependent RecD-like DNA helicase [Deltaproteobacteria bacterium]